MPKKKKSKTKNKKSIKKKKTKIKKRKPVKSKKFKTKKSKLVKKSSNKIQENQELIIKTKPDWVKSSLANKSQYAKKYKDSIKITMNFGKKKERELLG